MKNVIQYYNFGLLFVWLMIQKYKLDKNILHK